ncbi:MAG TPA: ABC transporter permease [Methanomassiliicoccales archaeon]|nr:ABC transporter permease [Methanomassiliicoccales archaeon]
MSVGIATKRARSDGVGEQYFHIDHRPHRKLTLGLGAVGVSLGILIWWVLSALVRTAYLPSPYAVAVTLYNLFTGYDHISGLTMWQLISDTLSHYFPAFILAFLLALPIGMLIGISRVADSLSRPFVEVLRPIAPIVFGPLFLIVLGQGQGVFMIVFLGVFIPLVSQIQFGVQHIDPLVLDLGQTMGAHGWTLFRKVIIPSIAPNILAGLKVAIGIGWICIIEGELILGTPGIGAFVLWNSQLGLYSQMFAGIVLISVIGILTYAVGWTVEHMVSKKLGMILESAPVTHC